MIAPIKVQGAAESVARLALLKQRMQERILRNSLRQAQKPGVRLAKQFVRIESKTMQRAIGVKEGRPKRGSVTHVIGPRRRMGRFVVAENGRHRAANKGERLLPRGALVMVWRDPVKYGHLLEFGHRIVRKGVEIGQVQPYPFMQPAFDRSAPAARAEFEKQIKLRTFAALRS